MNTVSEKICMHHVGGRGGTRSFPSGTAFEKDLISVLYDADPDCVDQIKNFAVRAGSECHVLPYCLAGSAGSAVLHLNYDPFTSSLLESNPDYGRFYEVSHYPRTHDYLWSEAARTVRQSKTDVRTLDEIVGSPDRNILPPDFLSLDVQGAEFAILKGAVKTLRSATLAVVAELEFHPLYKDQPLFGDVSALLSAQGFHMVRFLHTQEMAPFRYPKGLRGHGFVTSSDVLFLRRIDSVLAMSADVRNRAMAKLAVISIVYGQVEYGLECLAQEGLVAWLFAQQKGGSALAYVDFLLAMHDAANHVPQVMPPTFADLFTVEQSYARFADMAPTAGPASTSRDRNHGGTLRACVKACPPLRSFLLRVQAAWRAWVREGHRQGLEKRTPVELLLTRYGLESVADLLATRRER